MERIRRPDGLRSKASRGWKSMRGADEDFVVGDTPFLDDEALEYFVRQLQETKTYVEYGTGGSTVFAASAGCTVIAVETDPAFARAVEKVLPRGHSVDIEVVDIGPVGRWGIPTNTGWSRTFHTLWPRYPIAPWQRIESRDVAGPDFVMVDGRFRVASALTALMNMGVGAGKVMIDDYVDRPEYWVLESLGEVIAMPGRAIVLGGARVERHRLELALSEYVLDWR